jgi:transposase
MKAIIPPLNEQEAEIAAYSQLFKIDEPLYITRIDWNHESREVDVYVDFRRGAKFVCPKCGRDNCAVDKTADKSWKTLPIHHYECRIHLRTPYVKCICGTSIFRPHWENGSTKFTIWFEGDVLKLVKAGLPVSYVAKRVGEHDTLIWRIVKRYVNAEYEKLDFSSVRRIAVDEISVGAGYKFVTVFTDIDTSRVLFIANGKKGTTFAQFLKEAKKHGLKKKNITDIGIDMSSAFIAAAKKYFPKAEITFDKFHVLKLLNKAVNEVRKSEKGHKDCMYELYKRQGNLTRKQKKTLNEVLSLNATIAKAYELKETFFDIMSYDISIDQAEELFHEWMYETCTADVEIKPIIKFAETVDKHWDGIVRYFGSRVTNGIAEGINSLIRIVQGIARGFPNKSNLKAMVYLKEAIE